MVRAAALQTRQAKSAVNCEDLAGVCLTTKTVKTRQGEPMEFLTFEDHTDVFECVLFPDQYKVFNDLVLGINGFLQSLNIPIPSASPTGLFMDPLKQKGHRSNPLPIHRSGESASTHPSITELESVDEMKRQMRRSPYLPDWYESIQNREVADDPGPGTS